MPAGTWARVQVPVRPSEGDLGQLGETFNKMTQELRTQRDDIVRARDLIDSRRRFTEAVLAGASIQFQLGFPSGAVASCLSTYSMNYLDRFFLDGENGFAELQPATNYGPIKGRTHKGELNYPHIAHQTRQMEEMSDILLAGKQPIVPVDGGEALKDLKIIVAIYQATQTGKKVELSAL